jgi:prophage regulatory protein
MMAHRIIRIKAVRELTGLSDTSIWRREQEGIFPMRRNLGGRAVGWFYDEVLAWLENAPPKRTVTNN